MSDDVVIRFENVSKRYKRTFGGLRHLVQDGVDRLLGRNDGGPPEERYLWALRDVSFEVKKGEILGIIGLNGAGKSTILKLASRITRPTAGNIEVKGTLGALIEVGAGFHPELTGRENVYMNGSILGMSRDEIEDKYESIVDFAELDGFMDMPVKRYSSGMYVRLGFAVAAHLEPDIFLRDEVLAVGDAGFQQKCLNKIQELKERETTIILVSHHMYNIARHCDRVLWLSHGNISAFGEPDEVTQAYLDGIQDTTNIKKLAQNSNTTFSFEDYKCYCNGLVTIESVHLTTSDGTVTNTFKTGDVAQVNIRYHAQKPIQDPIFAIAILDMNGRYLSHVTTRHDSFSIDFLFGKGTIIFRLDPLIILRGQYSINISIRDGSSLNALVHVTKADVFSVIGPPLSNRFIGGEVNMPHKWSISSSDFSIRKTEL